MERVVTKCQERPVPAKSFLTVEIGCLFAMLCSQTAGGK